jgi:hypothetical protein
MYELTLQPECKAISERLTLPQYFLKSLTSDVDHYNINHLDLSTLNLSLIWQPFHSSFLNTSFVTIPKKLNDIAEVPIDDFIDKIHLLNQEITPESDDGAFVFSSRFIYIITGVLGVCLIALIVFLLIKRKLKLKLCAKDIKLDRGTSAGHDGTAGPHCSPAVKYFPVNESITSCPIVQAGNETTAPLLASAPTNESIIRSLYPVVIRK